LVIFLISQHQVIIGGTQQLSEIMGKTLQQMQNVIVELEAPVHRIEQSNDMVTVSFIKHNQVEKIHGSFVIVTVPPPLACRIIYSPPLSSLRDSLTQRMRMGAVIKCFIFFSKPFWRDQGLSGEIFTDGGPICNYYDASLDDGNLFALFGFIAGKHALKCIHKSPEERKAKIVEQLVILLGKEAANPVGYLEKNWPNDPWSRGGYMGVMTPNDVRNAGHLLRETSGRIYWAGTETSVEWYGYMEGALESAERTYELILHHFQSAKL